MSISTLLELGRQGLQVAQAQINTTSENIANVETEGYSRRRVVATSTSVNGGVYITTPVGQPIAGGISITAYERMRDRLLQDASWNARTALGSANEESRILSALEEVFAVGSDGSLSNALSEYWNAWSDVADQPTDVGTRRTLLSKAQTLTYTVQQTAQNIENIGLEAKNQLQTGIDEANRIMHEIASLNQTIREANYIQSPDLSSEDKRDQLVKELAEFVPVKVQEDQSGYQITINGMVGVQGEHVFELELRQNAGETPQVFFEGTNTPYRTDAASDGKIGAWIRTIDYVQNDLMGALDTFVSDLVTNTNTIHAAGFSLDGAQTGLNFFNPTGTTALTFSLQGLTPEQISVAGPSADSPPISLGSGDSTQANLIVGLRTEYENRVIDLTAQVGNKVKDASTRATGNAAVSEQLAGMEAGVSGVSMDDELTNLIKFQQSYAAAARVLTTAQEMMDTILSL